MVQLPDGMPLRMQWLPKDERGYPVPWFIAWTGEDGTPTMAGMGKPDFRVADMRKLEKAIKQWRCWSCGEPMGKHKVFVIGPMCAINRVIAEPPHHRDCAQWSVQACPFLSKPRMRRLGNDDLPDGCVAPAGVGLARNPGAICLWETDRYQIERHGNGVLFRLGDPTHVEWWAEGRKATRDEVLHSIDTGLPILEKLAKAEGRAAVEQLYDQRDRALLLLPAA